MSQKVITVFGATGSQGSSVIRSLQANIGKPFKIRGITRNPLSASAQGLAASGVEVVQADGWDKDSLVAAFNSSWAVFANTNSDDAVFENSGETRTEADLGKLIVDAAVEAGVEVFVYSGMASAKESSKGKIPVTAFDDKHAIGEYAKATNAFKSTVVVSAGWYFENFLIQEMAPVFGGFPYTPSEDGVLVYRCPKWGGKEDVPFIAIGDDYGDIVHGIFIDPEKYNGSLVQGVSDILSFEDAVGAFEKATGKKSRFEEIEQWTNFETYGSRALETVKYMFGFCQESGGRYYGVETEKGTASNLKKKAAEARGKAGDETELVTLEAWFRGHFGDK